MWNAAISLWAESAIPNPPPRGWRDWVLAGIVVVAVTVEGVLRPDLV